jgi:hypothetical protein
LPHGLTENHRAKSRKDLEEVHWRHNRSNPPFLCEDEGQSE